MSAYPKPPSHGDKKGRDAFAGNVRSYEDGFAAGWCDARAEQIVSQSDLGTAGRAGMIALAVVDATARGWLDLLRAECRKRGVEL